MTKTSKKEHLRQRLTTRRRKVRDDVQRRAHEAAASDTHPGTVAPARSPGPVRQDEAVLMGLQKRTATLIRLDEALAKLDAPGSDTCFECARHLDEGRVGPRRRAVRCPACEAKRAPADRHAAAHLPRSSQ